MKTINKEQAKQLISETNGRIFSAYYIKKDNTHRLINARLKVTKGLKENAKPQPYKTSKYNLMTVYDMRNNGYRMINLNTLQQLKVNKQMYNIKQ